MAARSADLEVFWTFLMGNFFLPKCLGKGSIKKKNLEFSRFSGWVGLEKSIFQI